MNLAILSILMIVRLKQCLTEDYDLKVDDDDLMVDDEDMAYYDSDGGVAVGSRHFSNGSILKDDKMKIKIMDIADYVNQDKDVTKLIMENEFEETEGVNESEPNSAPGLWIKKEHHVENKSEDLSSKHIKSSNVHININNYNSPENSKLNIPQPKGEATYHKPGIKININNFNPLGPILANETQKQHDNIIYTFNGKVDPSPIDGFQRNQGKKNADYSVLLHKDLIQKKKKFAEKSKGQISSNRPYEGQKNVIHSKKENITYKNNSKSERKEGNAIKGKQEKPIELSVTRTEKAKEKVVDKKDESDQFITNSVSEKEKTQNHKGKHAKSNSELSDIKPRTRNFVSVSIGNATTIYENYENETKIPQGDKENWIDTKRKSKLLMTHSNSNRKKEMKEPLQKEQMHSDYSDTVPFPKEQVDSTTEKTARKIQNQREFEAFKKAFREHLRRRISSKNRQRNQDPNSKKNKKQSAKDARKKIRHTGSEMKTTKTKSYKISTRTLNGAKERRWSTVRVK